MGLFDRFRGDRQESAEEVTKQPEKAEQVPETEKTARSRALNERVRNAKQRISGINAKADSSRREMAAVSEALDRIDPEWKQGSDSFSRDSGSEMQAVAKAMMETYNRHSQAFDSALSELGDANTEYALAANHAEAFDKYGVDLEVRAKEIEDRKMELEQSLSQSDKLTEGNGMGTRPNLENYLALDAESQAIASGTWEKRPEGGWLPKEADVPDFMPNFKKTQVNFLTGKYHTDPDAVAREIESGRRQKRHEDLNIREGRAPDAF